MQAAPPVAPVRRLLKEVALLAKGGALGALVTFAAAPVLSRLYAPEAFGVAALVAVLVAMGLPLVCARYELAIVTSRRRGDALAVVALCLVLAGGGAALAWALAAWLVPVAARAAPGLAPAIGYLPALPLLLAGWGVVEALRQWHLRTGRLALISRSQVAQAVVSVAVQLSLGAGGSGAWGLLSGQVAGLAVAAAYLAWGARRGLAAWARRHRGRAAALMWAAAVRHRRNAALLPWGGVLDALGQQLPSLALTLAHGPAAAGAYAMAERMLKTPLGLVMQPAQQANFRALAEAERQGAGARRYLARWFALVLAAGIPALVLLALMGEDIFALVLGEPWRPAGNMAVALGPLMLAASVVAPVSSLLVVRGRQHFLLGLQILFVCAGAAGLAAGGDALTMVRAFAVAQTLVYLLYAFILWRSSR